MVAEPGACGGLVEDIFDDLGAEAAGDFAVAAEGVLSGGPALLVSGGAVGARLRAHTGRDEEVQALAKPGVVVLAGVARDPGRGQAAVARVAAVGGAAVHVPLDVTDAESVDAAAKWVDREYGRLDALVNNAGILLEREHKPSGTSMTVLRQTFDTNVFGVVQVTNAMLPLLLRAPLARIVNISSELGSLGLTSDPDQVQSRFRLLAYNSSKTALNAITVSYANELRRTSVKVNAADPGYCATDVNGFSGRRMAAQGANVVVTLATLGPDGPTGGYFNEEGPVPW